MGVSEGNASPWMMEAFRLVPSKTCLYALFPLAGSDLYCFAKTVVPVALS